MLETGLIRILRLISKFKTSQTGQVIITIHILSNISISKENQTIKLGQLIEHKMRKTLPEKLYTKCDVEACPRPFHEKLKLGSTV